MMAAGLLALSACSSPDTQEPVELQPGAYTVSLSGSDRMDRCIKDGANTYPETLVRPYLAGNEGCSTAHFTRTGNLLNGTATCPLDPQRAEGEVLYKFSGTISATGIEGSINTDWNIERAQDPDMAKAAKAMGAVSIPLSAKRTGDCSGNERSAVAPSRSAGFADDHDQPAEVTEE